MKKSHQKPVFNTKKLAKLSFSPSTVRKVLIKLKEENKNVIEASKVDTSKLNVRFEL